MQSSLFTVLATAAALAGARDQIHHDADAYNDGQWGAIPTNRYHSTREVSPEIQVNIWNKDAMSKSGSHILLQHDLPAGASRRAGAPALSASPLILRTDDLSAVYMNHSFPGVANVDVQSYGGEPILSFYGGPLEESTTIGNGYIFGYDQQYNEVGRLSAAHLKVGADAHEFTMTGDRTAIVTAYETIEWDLRPHGGDEHGLVLDSVFQEVDLDTFEVLFQWRASEHVALDQSHQPLPDPADAGTYGWDFFHLTSVQKSEAGDYLVSGAHTHALYLVAGGDGRVAWTLGGRANDFAELPPRDAARRFSAPLLAMAWQHHARFYPGRGGRELTVFDNHGVSINGWGCAGNCSRGLHLEVDAAARTARLVDEFLHPRGLWSVSQGSVQVLDEGGNVFVGWGRNPAVTEHRPGGECVLDVQFSPWRSPATGWRGLDSYRAVRVDWAAARPRWAPDLAAAPGADGRGVTAWASWNGATGVRWWVLLAADRERDLDGARSVVARAQRDGFETALWAEGLRARYLRAVAVGDAGEILGASDVWDVRYGVKRPAHYPVTEVEEKPEQAGGGQSGHGQGGKNDDDEAEEETPGMPELTYHDLFPNEWNFGGMLVRITGLGLGVWLFSRLF